MHGKISADGIKGIYPMLFALFGRDGALDRQAMKRQTDAMVTAGVHGIAIMGLASECNKLSLAERRTLIDWVAEDLAGRLPLSVTIPGPNAAEQIALARHAQACGADWLVLQPPPVIGVSEVALKTYFSGVLQAVELPTGLQIAPQYLGSTLSPEGAIELSQKHENFRILKVEMSGYDAASLARQLEGRFAIFNGQDGVDLPDSLRGGCAGCIPGAELADVLALIFNGLTSARAEEKAAADEAYVRFMPLLSFMMDTLDRFLVYGKRILCQRLDLPPENAAVRSPAGEMDVEGEAIVKHWTQGIGKLA
jgi:2-keto-3-deoxy-L-arabinonate dehydratase